MRGDRSRQEHSRVNLTANLGDPDTRTWRTKALAFNRTAFMNQEGVFDPGVTSTQGVESENGNTNGVPSQKSGRQAGTITLLYHKPVCFAAIIIAGALIACSVVIPIALQVKQTQDDEPISYTEYKVTITVNNREYAPEMANNASLEFVTTAIDFCTRIGDLITKANNTIGTTFEGCLVTEFRNGSVIVDFILVFQSLPNSTPLTADLRSVLSNDQVDDAVVTIDGFEYKASSVIIEETAVSKTNSLHQVTCGPGPTVSNGEVTSPGVTYGDILTVSCDEGYTISGNKQLTCKMSNSWGLMPTCTITQCEELTMPEHSIPSSNQTANRTYGSNITFSCTTGYTLDGNSTIHCLSNGSWTAAPECIPLVCPNLDTVLPENSENNVSTNNMNYTGGFKVRVTCKEGYELVHYSTCSLRHQWLGENKCEQITCQPFTPLNNSRIFNDSTDQVYVYGSKLTINCDSGYITQGNVTAEITCMSNKHWSSAPLCEPVDCGQPSLPEHAVHTKISNVSLNATYKVPCMAGYHISGESEITCSPNGTWSEMPVCEPVHCVSVPNVGHAHLNESTGTHFLDEARYACDDGYETNTTLTAECTFTGHWSSVSDCLPVTCCEINVLHATVNGSNGHYGDTLEVACDTGFDLVGNNIITCQSNRAWTEVPHCRQVVCNDTIVPPEHAYIPCYLREASFGKYITLNCSEGYAPENDGKILCLADGTWTNIPNCHPVPCSMFTYPDHSTVSVNANETKYYMDTLTITCQDGYKIKGEGTVTCEADGLWSNSPTCEPLACQKVTPPHHAYFTTPMSGVSSVNDVYTVECDEGYELNGIPNITCLINETWSDLPTCSLVRCIPPTVPYSELIEGSPDQSFYTDTITVGCTYGYAMLGNETSQCLSNATWTALPECKLVECPDFNVPTDGFIAQKSTNSVSRFGDSIVIECDTGYFMIGDANTSCQANQKWSSQPICEIVKCPAMENIENGFIEVLLDQDREYNDSVSAVCNIGYENTTMAFCKIDGTWDATGICTIVDCNAWTGSLENGTVLNTTGTTYGSQIMFSCDENHILIGRNNIKCQANKSWEDIPVCLRADCDALGPVQNGYIGRVNDSTYEVVCNSGYILNGTSSTFHCELGGTWTPIPTCQIITCPSQEPEIPGGRIVTQTGITGGSSITFACNPGYLLIGNSTVLCRPTGDWDDIPRCELLDCGMPEQLVYGRYMGNLNTRFNTTLTAECLAGYNVANMTSTTTCLETGEWSQSISCEPLQCPPLTIDNGMVLAYSNGMNFGSIAQYTCNIGFQKIDNEIATCNASGLWEQTSGCQKIVNCGIPTPVSNGKYVNISGIMSSDSAIVECDVGYEIKGNATLVCDANSDGDWSVYPECTIVDCGIPSAPANSKDFTVGETTYGSTFNITCVQGFSRRYNDSMECREDGHWFVVKGCVIDCGLYDMVDHATVDFQNGTDLNSIIRVRCNDGYYLFNGTHDTVRCTEYGEWEGDPYCVDKAPGHPYVRCNDNAVTELIGTNITTKCSTRDIDRVDYLRIQLNGEELYQTNASAISGSISITNDITVEVDMASNLVMFTITVHCGHKGTFSVNINDIAGDDFELRVLSKPSFECIEVPKNVHLQQFTQITCTADRGRNQHGDSITEIIMEFKTQDADTYRTFPEQRFITLSNVDDTCLHITTFTLSFYPDVTFNDTDFRCALISQSNSTQMEITDPYNMILKEQNVRFKDSMSSMSLFIEDPLTLECFADYVPGFKNMSIKQNGERLATLDESGSLEGSDENIHVDGAFTFPNGYLKYNIVTSQCSTKGTYTCHVYMYDNSEISTLIDVHMLRAPTHPDLDLSIEVIDNQSPWDEFPTRCSGGLGYPMGNISLEANVGGSFITLNTSFEFTNNDTDCSSHGRLTYYETYNMDWEGTDMRCVVNNDHIYPYMYELYVSTNVRVIQGSICDEESRRQGTRLKHPFACYAAVTCTATRIIPRYDCTLRTQCYNGVTAMCESCGLTNRCINHPKSTPTTPIPTADLACPRTLVVTKDDSVTIECTLSNEEINLTNLTLWHVTITNDLGTTLLDTRTVHASFQSDTDVTSQSLSYIISPDLYVNISSSAIVTTIDISDCLMGGRYTFEYVGMKSLQSVTEIIIPASASAPDFSKTPPSYYSDQETIVTCSGNVGNPPAELVLRADGHPDIDMVLGISPTALGDQTDPSTCGNIRTLSYPFYIRDIMENLKLFCETDLGNGTSFQSDMETLQISEPMLTFGDSPERVPLGASFEMTCSWKPALSAAETVVIRRRATGTEEYVDVVSFTDGQVQELLAGITGQYAVTTDTYGNSITVAFATINCVDEGEYVCEASVGNEIVGKVQKLLFAEGMPESPTLTLPTRLIVDSPTLQKSDYLQCIADVGYRQPYDIRFEYQSASTGSYEPFTLGQEIALENSTHAQDCRTVLTRRRHAITFDSQWDDVSFRCVVYNTLNHSMVVASSEKTIQLINDHCDGTNDETYDCHPYSCHLYTRCHSSGFLSVGTCKEDCAYIRSTSWAHDAECNPCGCTDCASSRNKRCPCN